MKRLKIFSVAASVALASLALPRVADARLDSSFDVLNFKPAISNSNDYFGVYSSETLKREGWNTGFYVDWGHRPLVLPQNPAFSGTAYTIEELLVGNFYGTYGIRNWLSAGINIPIVFWEELSSFEGTGGPLVNENKVSLGDIRFELKFRILDNSDSLVGLALIPFVTAPSGDSTVFAGNGAVTGGIRIPLDFNINERVHIALNVGFLGRDDVTINNVRIDDQVLLGLGFNIKIIERLAFIGEVETQPVVRDFFANQTQTPAEARGGLRIKILDSLGVNVGGGAGLTNGVGSPSYRTFLGLNYTWAPAPCGPCSQPQVESRQIKIDQVIHFEFDKATIRSESFPILNDVIATIKNNPDIKRVKIEGYTDSVGSDAYNQTLSNARANSVKHYLVNHGVSATMLDSVGYGESNPVASNDTAEGRAANRRTVFMVE